MKRLLIILSLVLLSGLILSGCKSKSNKDNTLTIGMELAYPPFETKKMKKAIQQV